MLRDQAHQILDCMQQVSAIRVLESVCMLKQLAPQEQRLVYWPAVWEQELPIMVLMHLRQQQPQPTTGFRPTRKVVQQIGQGISIREMLLSKEVSQSELVPASEYLARF